MRGDVRNLVLVALPPRIYPLSAWSACCAYSGMFPCFFGGFVCILFSVISNACIKRLRVCFGRMISSMNPSSAAWYGVANFSL